MIKALLVDFDGTLVDTHAANLAAYRLALDEVGLDYDQKLLTNVVGRLAWRPMLQSLLPNHPFKHEVIAQRKRQIYSDMTSQVRVNHALVKILRILKPQLKIALVTAASPESVKPILVAKRLFDLFTVIVTSADVERQKPDPQPFEYASQLLGVTAEECLVFEDSDIGITAAHAFGAQVWKVDWLTHF